MVLVKLAREGDKKDVVLVNFQAHPDHSTYLGFYQIAADFVGPLRDELEKLSGASVAYFTGASGNQNPISKIPEENHGLSWREYGAKLGQLAGMVVLHVLLMEGQTLPWLFDLPLQSLAVLALIPIWLYNGEKGRGGKVMQWAGYLFYPLHLIVLVVLRRVF
jgi:hypothetical protein